MAVRVAYTNPETGETLHWTIPEPLICRFCEAGDHAQHTTIAAIVRGRATFCICPQCLDAIEGIS